MATVRGRSLDRFLRRKVVTKPMGLLALSLQALLLSAIPAFAGATAHVPEPASIGLFVTGAAAVLYLRKRLRK
jgi:hypothetical protein